MFLDQVVEIDLYTYLRNQRFTDPDERYTDMVELWLYVPLPVGRSLTLPLTGRKQHYGRRMSFICQYCSRRVQKLYVHPRHFNGANYTIGCRKCHQLKYVTQYRKDNFNKREVSQYKLTRLEKQNRRYWYGDKLTQFGKRHQKLKENSKTLVDIMAEIERGAPELLSLISNRRDVYPRKQAFVSGLPELPIIP